MIAPKKYKWARIWVSAVDCLDGFCVEILEHQGKLDFAIKTEWWPTLDMAEAWAGRQGIVRLERI